MIVTPKQQRAIDRLQDKWPGAMVDAEGTQQMRSTVQGAEYFVNVIVLLADAEVRMWTLDADGVVVMESGAGPKE